MELLRLTCLGQPLLLEASMAGWQQLSFGGAIVAQTAASEHNEGKFSHEFTLLLHPGAGPDAGAAPGSGVTGPGAVPPAAAADMYAGMQAGVSLAKPRHLVCRLEIDLQWQPFSLSYQFSVDGVVAAQGSRDTKDIERQQPEHRAPPPSGGTSLINLGILAMKLLKSAKFVKVALAGLSVAAYSWLFSFQFALALIGCLVFHEYGHLRAMRYFGLKTKGMYLIPFFGGAAVTEDKINTRWQDVAIAAMGPSFGLLLSLALLVAHWLTGIPWLGALSAFNALLNLFNLLPILPLDGGHILKSVAFSINSKLGLAVCVAAIGGGVLLCYEFRMSLFALMLILGGVEVVLEWRGRHDSHLLPLDRYGQVFSTVWYLAMVGALIAVVWHFAASGDPALGLPRTILQS